MKSACRIFTLAIVFVFASAAIAGATSIMKLDADKLFNGADLIVTGKVIGLESKKIDGAMTSIVTEVSIKIESTLKGEAASIISVRIPGGKTGDIGLMVPGAPVFEKDDKVLLSLEKDKSLRYRIRGFHQGRFSLMEDIGSGKLMAVQDPFKKIVKAPAICEEDESECMTKSPVKFTLEEIRRIIGQKP